LQRRFMIDTNVFIAAFKSGYTATTKLLIKLLLDPEIELIADDVLIKEYEKWFNLLTSKLPKIKKQAELLYHLILTKVKVENPGKEHIEAVRPYMLETEIADIYHAAACFKTNSILITNDKDFQELKNHGIIQVWSISEAIRRLLK